MQFDRIFLLVPAQVFVTRYSQSWSSSCRASGRCTFNLQGVLDKLTRRRRG